MPGIDQMNAERFDEGRLARAGRAADPHSGRGSGGGQDRVEQGNRLGAVIRAGRLHQRDGPRQRPAIAGAYGVGKLGRH